MKRIPPAEKAFKRELFWASAFFAICFLALLSIGAYVIIKDLGEKEVFRLLDRYTNELDTMMKTIPETEKAKGFQYEKIVTTRINQFMVEKKVFDSYELYDSDGRLIRREDLLKGGQVFSAPEIQGPPPGYAQVEIRNKMPIEVSVQVAPGKMGKAVLNVSSQVLAMQAKEFRNEMILKFSTMLFLLFLMLLFSYLYVLRLLKVSREVQGESEEQKRLSYLGLLSSGLAHEIKNPLNSLKLNVQLLEEGLKTESRSDELLASVGPMMEQIRRLEKLTRDFLLYAKPSEPEMKVQSLKPVIDELLFLFSGDARDKGVTLKFSPPEHLKEVPIDQNMIRIALSNLLLNAIQATGKDGEVSVEMRDSGNEVQVDIADSGPGIPADNRDKVFDIFFTNKSGGTGLGLSIAKRFVELHRGKIELIPQEDGARFRVTLRVFPDSGD